jgi:DNA-3-methyladenine glycosylase
VKVARDLLGRQIVRKVEGKWLRARIVETEAYLEHGDEAAHCSRGPTPRARVMFGEPGTIYVYFIYGNYHMLNFVTEKPGRAGAVLIRAVEPLEGLEVMRRKRKRVTPHELTNGPAKLVLALGINDSLNGKPLGLPHLAVTEGKRVASRDVVTTTRIGINVAKELPLRFYEKGNAFVSRL